MSYLYHPGHPITPTPVTPITPADLPFDPIRFNRFYPKGSLSVLGEVTPEDRYLCGDGVYLVKTHPEGMECLELGCVIHNPISLHTSWPTHWRWDRKMMERICPCGIGHPAVEHLRWFARAHGEALAKYEAVHGCCGCDCQAVKPEWEGK